MTAPTSSQSADEMGVAVRRMAPIVAAAASGVRLLFEERAAVEENLRAPCFKRRWLAWANIVEWFGAVNDYSGVVTKEWNIDTNPNRDVMASRGAAVFCGTCIYNALTFLCSAMLVPI